MEIERSGVKNKQTETGARMQVDGCRAKDGGRGLSRRLTEVGSSCVCRWARLPKSGNLGPPSSSPSHVISQRDLEYSLSWPLTIATINITNCPSLNCAAQS
jgi:hypothetical protein